MGGGGGEKTTSPPRVWEILTRSMGGKNVYIYNICIHSLYIYIYIYIAYVCVFSSHSFWTSSSLDVPAGVTQEEGHIGFLILLSAVRASIFLARRIQPFISLVDREVEFCVLTI